MNDVTSPAAEHFLDRFFAAPNKLTLAKKPDLSPWIARITRRDPLPTVLPCWREGAHIDWYALAFDAPQLRSLSESLSAFVGPTHSTFRGQRAVLDLADPIQAAVQDFTAGRAFSFHGPDAKSVWTALERMRQLWESGPKRHHTIQRPIGAVLRDFHMALLAGLEEVAAATLNELQAAFQLDSVNLLFLRVELLACFARWQSLVTLPELPDLVRLRKPVAVTEALLRAVYHVYLSRFEDPPDPDGAIRAFRSVVIPQFGLLLANRSGMRSSEAIKCFMLFAATQSPPDTALRNELLTNCELTEVDRHYLTTLATCVTDSPILRVGAPLTVASEAARAGDYDYALTLLRVQPVSPTQVRLLCECALELDTLDSQSAAVAAVNALSEGDRDEFLRSRVSRRLWQGIQDPGAAPEVDIPVDDADPPPTDWLLWLDYLDRHEGRRGAREIAHRGATEWSVSGLLEHPDRATTFRQKLQCPRAQSSERALRDSLPHLLTYFRRDERWINSAFRDIYLSLFELLYVSTEGSRSDLTVFNELLDSLLTIGVSGPAEYRELVTNAIDLWNRYAAPATFAWGIDLLELLVIQPCPDSGIRLAFLDALLEGCHRFHRHVRAEVRSLMELLASDLGAVERVTDYFPSTTIGDLPEEDSLNALRQMSVAIYSLTESALRQVKQILEARYAGVKVSLNSDLVGTPRLKQLSRQADVFVVATASAKHAATQFIDANRPKDAPLLRSAGKGGASILATLRNHFDGKKETSGIGL